MPSIAMKQIPHLLTLFLVFLCFINFGALLTPLLLLHFDMVLSPQYHLHLLTRVHQSWPYLTRMQKSQRSVPCAKLVCRALISFIQQTNAALTSQIAGASLTVAVSAAVGGLLSLPL